MDFYEVLDQAVKLLRQRGRLTHRALKVQFKLDDETLEALKDEMRLSSAPGSPGCTCCTAYVASA